MLAFPLRALVALSVLLLPNVVAAWSDAGPPNSCNNGGAAWIECAVHDDCPSGQRCSEGRVCSCSPCTYREHCGDDGCRCAPLEVPTAPPGCTVVEESRNVYRVHCPDDAGTGEGCTLDGGPGCDELPSPEASDAAGCSAAPPGAPRAGFLLTLLALAAWRVARRRPR